jgi:hypothetical protein
MRFVNRLIAGVTIGVVGSGLAAAADGPSPARNDGVTDSDVVKAQEPMMTPQGNRPPNNLGAGPPVVRESADEVNGRSKIMKPDEASPSSVPQPSGKPTR